MNEQRPSTDLVARLSERVAKTGDARVAYCVKRIDSALDRDKTIRARADQPMPTASTMKLYFIAALYAAAAKCGSRALDDESPVGRGLLAERATGIEPATSQLGKVRST